MHAAPVSHAVGTSGTGPPRARAIKVAGRDRAGRERQAADRLAQEELKAAKSLEPKGYPHAGSLSGCVHPNYSYNRERG